MVKRRQGNLAPLRVESKTSGAERLKRQQFGIVNMEEWSIVVDGQLTLGARPGGGTVVSLSIPLPTRKDSKD